MWSVRGVGEYVAGGVVCGEGGVREEIVYKNINHITIWIKFIDSNSVRIESCVSPFVDHSFYNLFGGWEEFTVQSSEYSFLPRNLK